MKTLAQVATDFARLDGIDDTAMAAYEKDLRNLAQRHYLPPSEQKGRVFLYDSAAVFTIRLAQIAHDFGIPRITIDELTRFLLSPYPGKNENDPWRKPSEEMIEAASRGEDFSMHIVMDTARKYYVVSDLHRDEGDEDIVGLARQYGLVGIRTELSRCSLPASDIASSLRG